MVTAHNECAICLKDLNEKKSTITLCGHEFHSSCLFINCVVYNSKTCPCCRRNLYDINHIDSVNDGVNDGVNRVSDYKYIQCKETIYNDVKYFVDDSNNLVYDFNYIYVGIFSTALNVIIFDRH